MSWQWPTQPAGAAWPTAPAAPTPGAQYTPDQWAAMNAMQQQNWQQWMNWQQQYQQWQQQYGEQYAKQMALAGQPAQPPYVPSVPSIPSIPSVPTVSTVPTIPTVPQAPQVPTLQPPLPVDVKLAPPLPQEAKPPLPPDEAPKPPPDFNASVPPPSTMQNKQNNQNIYGRPNLAPPNYQNQGGQNYRGAPNSNQQGSRGAPPQNRPGASQQGPRTSGTSGTGGIGGIVGIGGITGEASTFGGGNRFNTTQPPPSLMNINIKSPYENSTRNQSFPETKPDFGNKRPGDFKDNFDNSKKNRWEADNEFQEQGKQWNQESYQQGGNMNDAQSKWPKGETSSNQQKRWSQDFPKPGNQSKPWSSLSNDKSWNTSKETFPPQGGNKEKSWGQSQSPRNQSWSSNANTSKPPPSRPNAEELSEAEKLFDKQFEQWEAQFNKWKDQNQNHPDKQQYKEYEAKWESWRTQLLDRREQMRKKRLGLSTPSTPVKTPVFSSTPQMNVPPSPSQTTPDNQQKDSKEALALTLLPAPSASVETEEKEATTEIKDPPQDDTDMSFLFSQPPKEQRTNIRSRRSSMKLEESITENLPADTSFLQSANANDGIPGLDLVKDEEDTEENDNEDDKKSHPDFEAISKGINTILGDAKLMNMLSLVSQNKNPTTGTPTQHTQTSPVQSSSNIVVPDDMNNSYQSNESFGNQNFPPDNQYNDSYSNDRFYEHSKDSGEFNRDYSPSQQGYDNRERPRDSNEFRGQQNFNRGGNFNQEPPNRNSGEFYPQNRGNFDNNRGPNTNFNQPFNRGPNNFNRGPLDFPNPSSGNNFDAPPNNFSAPPPNNFQRPPPNNLQGPPPNKFQGPPPNKFQGPSPNRGNDFNRSGPNPDNQQFNQGQQQNDFNRSNFEFNRGPNWGPNNRNNFNDTPNRAPNDFGQQNRAPLGMPPRGPMDGPRNFMDGPRNLDEPRNFNDGPRGHMDGAKGFNDGMGRGQDGSRGPMGGPRGNMDGQRGPMDGQKGPMDGQRGLMDGQRGPMDGQRGPMDGQRGPMDGQRGPMDGQRGPMDGQRGPMDGQRGPMDGQRSLMDGQRNLIDGQRGSMDGQRGSMDGQRGSMDGSGGSMDSSRPPMDNFRSPIDGPRGLMDGARSLMDGPRGPMDMSRGSMDGSRGFNEGQRDSMDNTRGFDNQRGPMNNRGPNNRDFNDGPRGFSDKGSLDGPRSLLDGSRGAFDNTRGAFDNSRGSFDNNRGPFDNNRGSFDNNRGSFDNNRGSFDNNRGSFDNNRGPFDNSRLSFDNSKGPMDNARGMDGPRGMMDSSRPINLMDIPRGQNDNNMRGPMDSSRSSNEGIRGPSMNNRFNNDQSNVNPWNQNESTRGDNFNQAPSGFNNQLKSQNSRNDDIEHRNQAGPIGANRVSQDYDDFRNRPNQFGSRTTERNFRGGDMFRGDFRDNNSSVPPRGSTEKYWDEALILKPVSVIDYGHKSVNKKESTFMEPVQTFDYNHASKNSDKPEQKLEKDNSRETSFNKYNRYSNSPSRPQSESYRSHEQPPRPPRINFEKNSFNKNKSFDRSNKYDENRDSPVYNKDTCRFEPKRAPYSQSSSDRFDNQSNRNRDSPHKFESNIEYDDIEDEDPFADDVDMVESSSTSKREKDAEKFINQANPAQAVAETKSKSKSSVMMVEDLLIPPGRNSRPQRIVIMLRGPPGSGKTFLAKLIKDKEVEQGGSAPRILSLDDYFMVETDKEIIEKETGRKTTVKEMVYEYEECMELSYRQSLERAFKKTITDGFFPFIILDCVNDKVKHFSEMWSFAKQNGFQVYVCQMELDVTACTKRNIHHRSEIEIERLVAGWENTLSHYLTLDATSLIQAACISEVEMEEVTTVSDEEDKDAEFEDHIISKWERMEPSGEKLAKLDGTNKPLRPKTMEDYLQMDDDIPEERPGVKRVRWADLEERRHQEKIRALGFVVGQTDWNRMLDPTQGSSALTQTKYIERVRRF